MGTPLLITLRYQNKYENPNNDSVEINNDSEEPNNDSEEPNNDSVETNNDSVETNNDSVETNNYELCDLDEIMKNDPVFFS